MMTTTSVDCWPFLRPLKKSFLAQTLSYMTFCCPNSKAVLLLHQNGTCYRYGEFKFELSSRAKVQKFWKPSPIEISNIVGMARGSSHILLLNDRGQIWSFGRNQLGQLGHNCQNDDTTFEPKLIANKNRFVSIRCGSEHSLALTDDGRVFAWGSNLCGQIRREFSRTTIQYQGSLFQVNELNCHRVIAVECGWEHSVALTEQGVVFCWGINRNGQLGIANSSVVIQKIGDVGYCPRPTRLDTTVVGGPVKCIAAGRRHTLLLTQHGGQVYVCGGIGGRNNHRSNNNVVSQPQLTKVPCLPFITQIVAHFMTDISILFAPDQSCYILKNIDMTSSSSSSSIIPQKLPPLFSNKIDSVFAMFLSQPDIPYSIPFEGPTKVTPLSGRLSKLFDNQDTDSDIQFLVEDKTINVHLCILRTTSSSSYFNRLFSNENHCKTIPITDYTYSIFHSYLRYLYTAILPKITSKSILKFLQISIKFEDNQLKHYCFTQVFDALSRENWSKYFKFSVRYQLSNVQITLANWIISECGSSIFTTKRFLSLSERLQRKLKKLIKSVDIHSECKFVLPSKSSRSKPNDEDTESDDEDSGPETDLNSNDSSNEFNPDCYPMYVPECHSASDSRNRFYNLNDSDSDDYDYNCGGSEDEDNEDDQQFDYSMDLL